MGCLIDAIAKLSTAQEHSPAFEEDVDAELAALGADVGAAGHGTVAAADDACITRCMLAFSVITTALSLPRTTLQGCNGGNMGAELAKINDTQVGAALMLSLLVGAAAGSFRCLLRLADYKLC